MSAIEYATVISIDWSDLSDADQKDIIEEAIEEDLGAVIDAIGIDDIIEHYMDYILESISSDTLVRAAYAQDADETCKVMQELLEEE